MSMTQSRLKSGEFPLGVPKGRGFIRKRTNVSKGGV
jgi:hypothetical protein